MVIRPTNYITSVIITLIFVLLTLLINFFHQLFFINIPIGFTFCSFFIKITIDLYFIQLYFC